MRSAFIGEVEILRPFDDQAFIFLLECFFEKFEDLGSLLWEMDDSMLNGSEDVELWNEFASL